MTDYRARIIEIAESYLRETAPSKFHLSAVGLERWNWPKHWCGIFCLACAHEAGLAQDVMWSFARKKPGVLFRLKRVKMPEPGDFGYIENHQHHTIVKRVWEDVNGVTQVDSVEGNTTGMDKFGQASYSCVAEKTRPLWKYAAFYSIQGWIDEATVIESPIIPIVRDTEPAPPPEPEPDPAPRTLRFGRPLMYGEDVEAWQEFLHSHDIDCGAVDGWFGRLTTRATKVFQNRAGVVADGVVGPETRAAMETTERAGKAKLR